MNLIFFLQLLNLFWVPSILSGSTIPIQLNSVGQPQDVLRRQEDSWKDELFELCEAPLVGVGECLQQFNRRDEVTRLQHLLFTNQGPAEVVVITGPPHVGKAAIVERVAMLMTDSNTQNWFKLSVRRTNWRDMESLCQSFVDAFGGGNGWGLSGSFSFSLFGADVQLEGSTSSEDAVEIITTAVIAGMKAGKNGRVLPVFWLNQAHLLFERAERIDGGREVIQEVFDLLLDIAKTGIGHVVMTADSVIFLDMTLHMQEYAAIRSVGDLDERLTCLYWEKYIPYILGTSPSSVSADDVYQVLGGRMMHLIDAHRQISSSEDLMELPLVRVAKMKIRELMGPEHDLWSLETGVMIVGTLLENNGCVPLDRMKFYVPTTIIKKMVLLSLLALVDNAPQGCPKGLVIMFPSPVSAYVAQGESQNFMLDLESFYQRDYSEYDVQ